jgi:predicted cupin superfamily sugar epimerase
VISSERENRLISVEEIKSSLGLKPLPVEGGYYAETYRSTIELPVGALAQGYESARPLATAIYYLLTPETFSALHRLPADEIYHFYLGDPVEMLQLLPDGSSRTVMLGSGIGEGIQVQAVVPAHVWQGSRLVPRGRFALLGTTMSPGFDPADYEAGNRDDLLRAYPAERELITALTR